MDMTGISHRCVPDTGRLAKLSPAALQTKILKEIKRSPEQDQVKVEVANNPVKPKRDRKEYMRAYMRKRRAKDGGQKKD